ncbi:MAG: hypothetical protein L0H73_17395 [Nitrococcus sp.]|nr:hypothetical protein [Nitrococcus sp.]
MNAEELKTVEQLSAFLNGTQPVAFAVAGDKDACYRWIERTLVRFGYRGLSKADKGAVIGLPDEGQRLPSGSPRCRSPTCTT